MDCTIRQLAEATKLVVGFAGELVFNTKNSYGTAHKFIDVSRLKVLGWNSWIVIECYLQYIWQWLQDHQEQLRG